MLTVQPMCRWVHGAVWTIRNIVFLQSHLLMRSRQHRGLMPTNIDSIYLETAASYRGAKKGCTESAVGYANLVVMVVAIAEAEELPFKNPLGLLLLR